MMDWRDLHLARRHADATLYLRCLQYGHYLWKRALAARALLAVDRALLCDMPSEAEVLRRHPLPYQAVRWLVAHTPPGVFIGNPRVHYQHLADRVRGPRALQRRWRAWACWQIVRDTRPDWPGDPHHEVREPDRCEIRTALVEHGLSGEVEWWEAACADASASGTVQNSRN